MTILSKHITSEQHWRNVRVMRRLWYASVAFLRFSVSMHKMIPPQYSMSKERPCHVRIGSSTSMKRCVWRWIVGMLECTCAYTYRVTLHTWCFYPNNALQAHNLNTTLYQHQCNVRLVTEVIRRCVWHRGRNNVESTLIQGWDGAATLMQHSDVFIKDNYSYSTIGLSSAWTRRII